MIPAALLLLILPLFSVTAQDAPDTLGIGPRVSLGNGVNTAWAEMVPRLAANGKRLYFVRKEATTNVGGTADQDDIYVSDRGADGSWQEARNVGAPLNTTGSDVLFWIAQDESVALLYHGRMVNGRERGLSIARRTASGWSEPKALEIDGLDNLGDYYYATLSPDRERLLIAYAVGNRYDLNLYLCRPKGNDLTRWYKPELIEGLNTPFIEGGASFSPDSRSLVFASDRPTGAGLGDIYISRRASEKWAFWTPPENLGTNVNTLTFEADAYFSPDGQALYVSRIGPLEPGSKGRTDIYRHELPEEIRLQRSILLKGRVVATETSDPIPGAKVWLEVVGEGRAVASTTSDDDGSFSIIILPGVQMKVVGSAVGYRQTSSILDMRGRTAGGGESNFLLALEPTEDLTRTVNTPQQNDATGIVDGVVVNFPSADATLDKTARKRVKRFYLSWRKTGASKKIIVTGHTDSIGSVATNRRLAGQRATAVANLLVSLGVDRSMVRTAALGESAPKYNNTEEAGRRANRRVEIRTE